MTPAARQAAVGVVLHQRYETPFDLQACFPKQADRAVLRRFRRGDKLVNWNWTCPVNWYLESSKRPDNQTPLAGKDASGRYSSDVVHALRSIGTSAGTSDGVVPPSWAHRDGGKPGREWFLHDPEKERQVHERWDAFQRIFAQWHAVTVPFAYAPDKLSPFALALLRYMKKGRMVASPELHPALKELRLQGLLGLLDNGMFYLTSQASKVQVPRGPQLVMLFQPSARELDKAVRKGVCFVN